MDRWRHPPQDRWDPAVVWRSPGYQQQSCFPGKEIQTAWSPLAPGFELGGRSGKFAVCSLVGSKTSS